MKHRVVTCFEYIAREVGVVMPEQTVAELFEKLREAFQGVKLRIDMLQKQQPPTTEASWVGCVNELVEWSKAAIVYVGKDSKIQNFKDMEMVTLGRRLIKLIEIFFLANVRYMHKNTPREWNKSRSQLVSAIGAFVRAHRNMPKQQNVTQDMARHGTLANIAVLQDMRQLLS